MAQTAKLFVHDGDQAVDLPPEFRFQGEEVLIRRDEETGDVILSQRVSDWDALFKLLHEIGPAEPEFMEGVEDPPLQPEEIF